MRPVLRGIRAVELVFPDLISSILYQLLQHLKRVYSQIQSCHSSLMGPVVWVNGGAVLFNCTVLSRGCDEQGN